MALRPVESTAGGIYPASLSQTINLWMGLDTFQGAGISNEWLRHAQVLQFVHQCAAQLAEAGENAEMALQLFLTAAQSASEHARLELIAYEFFEQVLWPVAIQLRCALSLYATQASEDTCLQSPCCHDFLAIACRPSYCLRRRSQTALLSGWHWLALWGLCSGAASFPLSPGPHWSTRPLGTLPNCCARRTSAALSWPALTSTGR